MYPEDHDLPALENIVKPIDNMNFDKISNFEPVKKLEQNSFTSYLNNLYKRHTDFEKIISQILPAEPFSNEYLVDFSKKATFVIGRSDSINIPLPFSFNYIGDREEGESNHLSVSLILCQKCRESIINQLTNGTKISLRINLYILPWFIDKLQNGIETYFNAQCPCINTTVLVTRSFKAYKGQIYDIIKENLRKDRYTVTADFNITNSQRIHFLRVEQK